MDERYKNDDLIHRYITNDLSDAERKHLEAQMAADPALKSKVAIQEEAYQLIQKSGPIHLKSRLQQMEAADAPIETSSPTSVRSIKSVWWMAASIVLIALVGWWFLSSPPPPSPESLLATHWQPYRNPSNLRGEAQSIILRAQAVELYSNQDFNQSALIWDRLMMVEGGGTPPDHFYWGISLLFSNPPKMKAAIQQLETVLQSDNDYIQQSWWYLGLAQWKLGQKEEARTYFERLVEKGGYKAKEAAIILEILNE